MSKTLLLVDDDDGDLQLALIGLKRYGFEYAIAIARDGQEALDRIYRSPPSAILLDIKMPRIDGLEFLRRLRADPKFITLPVAFLTSSGGDADKEEALSLGARYYFQKPSNMDGYCPIVQGLRDILNHTIEVKSSSTQH